MSFQYFEINVSFHGIWLGIWLGTHTHTDTHNTHTHTHTQECCSNEADFLLDFPTGFFPG